MRSIAPTKDPTNKDPIWQQACTDSQVYSRYFAHEINRNHLWSEHDHLIGGRYLEVCLLAYRQKCQYVLYVCQDITYYYQCHWNTKLYGRERMNIMLATEEWRALVQQEENAAYQVLPSPPPPLTTSDGSVASLVQHDNINTCPKIWREKICEWQFQVIDHW